MDIPDGIKARGVNHEYIPAPICSLVGFRAGGVPLAETVLRRATQVLHSLLPPSCRATIKPWSAALGGNMG